MTTPVRKIFEMSGMQKIIPEVKDKIEQALNVPKGQNKTGTECTIFKEVQYE